MHFTTNHVGQIIEATNLRTGSARRENQYYCPESSQKVYVALSGQGNNHFRHKPGHQICYYSSSSGKKRNRKQDWNEFLEVRRRLTSLFDLFNKEKQIYKKSSLQWETASTIIMVLPFYLPEKQILTKKKKADEEKKQLMLLIPQIITDQQYDNLQEDRKNVYKAIRQKFESFTFEFERIVQESFF